MCRKYINKRDFKKHRAKCEFEFLRVSYHTCKDRQEFIQIKDKTYKHCPYCGEKLGWKV